MECNNATTLQNLSTYAIEYKANPFAMFADELQYSSDVKPKIEAEDKITYTWIYKESETETYTITVIEDKSAKTWTLTVKECEKVTEHSDNETNTQTTSDAS